MQLISAVIPYWDFIYILQLEEYYNLRYFADLPRFIFRRNLQRSDKVGKTLRAKLTLILAIILTISIQLVSLLLITDKVHPIALVIFTVLNLLAIPVWVGLANIFLVPVINWQRRLTWRKAANLLDKYRQNLKIVVISGSFGKTTTKHLLYQMTEVNYRTQIVPGTINTPTGIAEWLIKNFDPNTRLLIVELEDYDHGGIAAGIEMIKPTHCLLVGLGDQHLLRFGSRQDLCEVYLELFNSAPQNSELYLTDNAMAYLKQYLKNGGRDLTVQFGERLRIVNTQSNDLDYLGIKLEPSLNSNAGLACLKSILPLLADLKISSDFAASSVRKLALPERRDQVTWVGGYQVIDNSFNINTAIFTHTINAAISSAGKANKQLIAVTAGIPELNSENISGNKDLASYLAENSDAILILKSRFQDEMASVIKQSAPAKLHLIQGRQQQAWEYLPKNFTPASNYIVLLLPELNDLYY